MESQLTAEDIKRLREFKAKLFDVYWYAFPTFYVHVLPHQELDMGKRGLVGNEKESGVVLAFGNSACKDISAQANYLYAELQFGFTWEKLIIPWDCMFRMYDKWQNSVTQLKVVLDAPVFEESEKTGSIEKTPPPKKTDVDSKIITVDFTKKK